MSEIKDCPKCGYDEITVDSSGSMMMSNISCDGCDFMLQKKVPEERIIEIWNKLKRR